MPLLDHFHLPLLGRRDWHAFHNNWATRISMDFNRRLPDPYFAEPNVQFGIEIDVATWKESSDSTVVTQESLQGSTSWTPPDPVLTIPFCPTTDIVEIAVYNPLAERRLVGAIELVSPANKDRPEHREAFVSKCETYLQQGAGLLIVDVVTERRANLHHALISRLSQNGFEADETRLYTSSYRPINDDGETTLRVWSERLEIGQPLPKMPLWLLGGLYLPVDLEGTYNDTCNDLKIRM